MSAEPNNIEKAYGLLWRTVTKDKQVHGARKQLLASIGGLHSDGQRRAIAWVLQEVGPMTTKEILELE